jgi:hypothetical protein
LQPYYPTTRKNLLGFTQEFDNAGWLKTNSSVTANVTTAPDGSMTADKLVENTANAVHQIDQVSSTSVSGTTYRYSAYIKAAERTRARIVLIFGGANGVLADANLSTGAIGSAASFGTATAGTSLIQEVGNGWYRCSVSGSSTTGAALQARVELLDSAGNRTYTGDGTSGIFIWGAQLSDSASLDPYVYNPGAAPASTAYFGPRFDYDPVTLAPKGLLIEESRTNSIRNNTMVGAVVGTPGTIPTNWIVSGSINGLTREVVSVGIEGGISYIDVRWSGTPTATSLVTIFFEPNNQIVAANGQSWAYSLFTRLVSGSTTNIGVVRANIIGNTSAGSGVSGQGGFVDLTPTSSSLSSQRTAISRTFTDATVERVNANIAITYTNGNPIDITLRVGLPQLEQGAFATSVIPTTTAAATRAADVAVMQGANFSNWYNATEGTVYSEFSSAFTAGTIFSIDAGSPNDRITTAMGGTLTGALSRSIVGGVAQATFTNTVNAFPSYNKLSFAYKVNDFAESANGATVLTDTSGTVPVVNLLNIGRNVSLGSYLSGHIRKIAYYPRKLSSSELQAITA